MDVKRVVFVLVIGLCTMGCQKDPPPALTLSSNSITISSKGEPMTIEVKSNISWRVFTNLPDWLTMDPASGKGDAQIQVKGVPNTKYPRTIDVQIIPTEMGIDLSASIRITQPSVHFEMDQTKVQLEDDGAAVRVALNTDAEWSVASAPEWSLITPRSGNGSSTVQISAAANAQKRERSGVISFKYYDGVISLPVAQKGNPRYNQSPDSPELIFPLHNATDISTYPSFEWSCSDPDGDPLSYTVCISENGTDFTEFGPYSHTKVYLEKEFKTSTSYFYKVKADDGEGGVACSDTYCFTTYHRPIYADGEVVGYMQSSKPKPIILVFTGDGYIKQDCNAGGLFEQNAAEGIEALFSIEPYKTYRDYFSVYMVFAHSLESGATQIDKGIYKMTAFGTTFDDTGTGMSTNTDKAFEYAQKVPGMLAYNINNTCVFMMVNQNRYAGTCWMWPSGKSVAICPVSRTSGNYSYAGVILHEGGGHGFGRLADEYVNSTTQIPSSEVTSYRASQGSGMYLNVDFISDPQQVLWSHFLGLSGYNKVGVFEGAALYRYGAWRSEETNCMINNIKYYSVACREQIVKRILTISGEGYTLEKFFANDYVRSPGAAMEAETKSFDPKTFIPLAPPVVVW